MANPTDYVSLSGDYGRAVGDATGYCQMPEVTVTEYRSKFRVFIPPGTNYIYLAIYEYGGQTAIARHEIPPTPVSINPDNFAPQSRTLDQLLASDQIISENNEGKLTVINQVLQGGTYVSVYQAGWLYVYVTGGKYSSVYYNKLQIGMDAATYNKWYDKYIKTSANWDKLIEGVTTYIPPSSPQPQPTSNPTDYISAYSGSTLDYGWATSKTILNLNLSGYVGKFRVFIPPAATSVTIEIQQENEFTVVSRHKQPPTTAGKVLDGLIPLTSYISNDYQLTQDPRYDDSLLILSHFDIITKDNCGWFYIKCGADPKSTTYINKITIEVDKDSYNGWYSTIVWDKDVEGVKIYGQEEVTTPGVGLTFAPAVLNFGTQLINKSKTLEFVMTNTSLLNITINSIECPDGFTWAFGVSDEDGGYESYDFVSIYRDGKVFKYTDNGVDKEIMYMGFKNIYNLYDPIVRSGNTIPITNYTSPFYFPFNMSTKTQHERFKIFIPYGTSDAKNILNFQIKTSPGAEMVAIVNWKYLPDYKYLDSDSYFDDSDYTTANASPLTLSDLYEQPFAKKFRCVNDTIYIISGCGFDEEKMMLSIEAYTQYSGWLYVILRIKTGKVTDIIFNSNVAVYAYYDQIKYNYDDFADPYGNGQYVPDSNPSPETNPTEYTTMHDCYHRFQENQNDRNLGYIELKPQYKEYHSSSAFTEQRIFIPPGTVDVDFGFGKTAYRTYISRFLNPPNDPTNFIQLEQKCSINGGIDTVACDADFFAKYVNSSDKLIPPASVQTIRKDPTDKREVKKNVTDLEKCKQDFYTLNLSAKGSSILSGTNQKITKEQAGWFYTNLSTGGLGTAGKFGAELPHANVFSLQVDIEKYNEWWDNGGVDGPINWNKDIEQYKTYNCLKYDKPPDKPICNTTINPTDYKTVHDPYYWLQNNVGEIQNYSEYYDEYNNYKRFSPTTKSPAYIYNTFISTDNFRSGAYGWKKVRMFIPPGTWNINLSISNLSNIQMQSWTKFSDIPKNTFASPIPTSGSSAPIPDYIEKEHYSYGEILNIFEAFTYRFETLSSGGWLYVNIDTTETKNISIYFKIDVDITLFNSWWTTCGGTNADKSINWDHDVENKITYSIPIQG